jgi:proline racemase
VVDELLHGSIVGTRFVGRLRAVAQGTSVTYHDTEVEGRAHRTGEHTFLHDPDVPLGWASASCCTDSPREWLALTA